MIKDYVKSQKHYWEEACFIPCASDRTVVERVVGRFFELQGEDLQGGLVVREYVDLEPLAVHSKSGMPLTLEYRVFVLDGEVVAILPYWEEGEYGDSEEPPIERLGGVIEARPAPFFTVDVAKTKAGDWIVVEIGDGQVSGLPERTDVPGFYRALHEKSESRRRSSGEER